MKLKIKETPNANASALEGEIDPAFHRETPRGAFSAG
jgi:hypothetical protein